MTVKAGQKCTAIRRIFVPANILEDVVKALGNALAQTLIGNPLNEKVKMGSLAGQSQREEVRDPGAKTAGSFSIGLWQP